MSRSPEAHPCVFCRIIAGRSPATFLHRDASVVAVLDIQPVNPGHLLVIPVKHVLRVTELGARAWTRMTALARSLSAALRTSGLRCEDVTWHIADGPFAGQDVPHLHLHVIPRWPRDGFGLRFPKGYDVLPSRAELDKAGARIRRACRLP